MGSLFLRTVRTLDMFLSFCFAAQRAVWLKPQSGAKESRSGGACLRQRNPLGDVRGVST